MRAKLRANGEGDFMRVLAAALCLGLGLGLALTAPPALAQAPAPPAAQPKLAPKIIRTVLNRTDVPGDSNYEVISAMVEIGPGFKAGRHFHHGLVQVTVLEGQFWLAVDDAPEKVLGAGQSLSLPLNAIHDEGAVGEAPVMLFAVYVVEKLKPLAETVK